LIIFACTYFFDIGYAQAKELTVDDVQAAKGNGLMTKEFEQELIQTTREISAVVESGIDLVQFCAIDDTYDTRTFANKLPRYRLEEMLENQISISKFSSQAECEAQCEKFGCEMEELEMLGYELPEGWEEWKI
jgi:hypothetical protein